MPVLSGGGSRTYYNVEVASSRIHNSNGGTPGIAIVFAHEEDPMYGITAYRYLTAKTLEYVAKDLKVLGWDPVEHAYRFEELDGEDKSPIAGAKATICVEDETYEGKVRPRVLFINPYGQQGGGSKGEPRERMEPKAAKSWGDQVRKALGVGATPSAPARPASDPKAASRKASTQQAVKDGIANQQGRGRSPTPAAAAPPADAAQGEDHDFEDIPFSWLIWLLPLAGLLYA